MKPLAFYNEHDKKAAAWLRELIKAGAIADGVVDERSILDIAPAELTGFTQCHFFAGIGVWSYALRRAGWPDDRPIWTGSCPCQPFSAAGKGGGFDDERHLWPAWHWLIQQCQSRVVAGEQVASKDAEPWLDLVQADMEGLGYAFGALAFPAAGVGAPHIRDRAYWLADHDIGRREGARLSGKQIQRRYELGAAGCIEAGRLAHHHGDGQQPRGEGLEAARYGQAAESDCGAGGLGDCEREGLEGQRGGHSSPPGQRPGSVRPVAAPGESGWLGNAERISAGRDAGTSAGEERGLALRPVGDDARSPGAAGGPGPINGRWQDADWLHCRDGKWRPVESRSFPLAHGVAGRVGRLRGYGNAIVSEAAAEFIRAYLEVSEGSTS